MPMKFRQRPSLQPSALGFAAVPWGKLLAGYCISSNIANKISQCLLHPNFHKFCGLFNVNSGVCVCVCSFSLSWFILPNRRATIRNHSPNFARPTFEALSLSPPFLQPAVQSLDRLLSGPLGWVLGWSVSNMVKPWFAWCGSRSKLISWAKPNIGFAMSTASFHQILWIISRVWWNP